MNVYDSFHEAPLDDEPEWEGDDSIPVGNRVTGHEPRTLVSVAAEPDRNLIVPYRHSEPGTVGDRVYALKRAHARFRGGGRLTALFLKPEAVKRTWGRFTGVGSFYRDFKQTQRKLGVPMTGEYDKATHVKLAPWYDALALALLQPSPRDVQIAKQLAWHMAFYNERHRIAYSQARPSQIGPVSRISRADCSGSVAAGCDWAEILPRVDWRWTNTDVQINFGTAVPDLRLALPGDVVLYGHGTDPNHEALYLGAKRVWSFGSYPARLLDVDYNRGTLGGRIAIRRFVP